MPGQSKIKAGDAFVRLFINDSQFRSVLNGAAKRLKSLGAGITKMGGALSGLGGAILAPFGAALKTFSSTGDQLDKMAARTGFTVESLSELAFAASQSGASLEDIEKAARGMARSMLNASEGSKASVDAFDALGLSVASLEKLSPEDQFNSIAVALSNIGDPTQRAALAMRIFGRAGSALIPLLKNGAGGMAALRAQANELGLVMTTEDATAAAAFTDALDQLWRQSKAVFLQIAGAVAGPLTEFMGSTRGIIATVIEWVKNNRGLVATVGAVGVVIAAAGLALTAFGGFVILAGAAVSGLATLLGILTSPLAIIVAAVGAAGVAFVKFTATGSAALGFLKDSFGPLAETVTETVSAIGSALARGDIEAAAGVLWAGLKLLFAQGVAKLREYWANFKNFWIDTAAAAFYGAQEVLANATAVGQNVMTQTWDFIRDGWTVTVNAVRSVWAGFVNFLANSWQKIKSFVGLSTEEAAQAAIDANNRALEATRDAIQQSQNETIGGRDQARQQKLREVEEARQRDLARIQANRDASTAARADDFQRELDQADRGVAEARANFNAARDRAAGPAAGGDGDAKTLKDTLQQALEDAGAAGSAVGAAAGGPESKATFNAALASQIFGGSSVADRTLRVNEEQLEELKGIRRKKQGIPVGDA